MNVLVLNEQQSKLQTLDIDIIKSVSGQFEASEIVSMFKDFFFNKMILDVTALKGYDLPLTYKTIAEGLNPDKVIFYLKEGTDLCTSGFLSRIIKFGIYNFTTNIDGVKYLVKKSNTLKDVEGILKMAEANAQTTNITNMQTTQDIEKSSNIMSNNTKLTPVQMGNEPIVIGFQNITTNAGATSLIYMLKKELSTTYNDKVVAIEIDKNDFLSFGDKKMISTSTNEVRSLIKRLTGAAVILVDLNNCTEKDLCTTVINLIEPSTIKLNNLMRRNRVIISALKDKKVILNKSLLNQKEVSEFEYESGLNILYNMPPLNDRKRNEVIADFLRVLRLVGQDSSNNSGGKIFGLFRK